MLKDIHCISIYKFWELSSPPLQIFTLQQFSADFFQLLVFLV